MKNLQKGFAAPLLIAVVAVLVIGGGVYYYSSKKTDTNLATPVDESTNITDTVPESVNSQIPSNWKTYKNSEWGFQISYPPEYRFLDMNANSKGPLHYLVPQKPPAESGNLATFIEIANFSETSEVKGIFQVVIVAQKAKNIADLNAQIKTEIASNMTSYNEKGISITQSQFNIDGHSYPAILFKSSKEEEMIIYYIHPSSITNNLQPPVTYIIKYTPGNDEIFKQIVSTIKFTSIVISDQSLHASATHNKDISWCDKISDLVLKNECYIAVRGPIFDTFPIDFNTIPHNSGGTGGSVNGTTLTIDGKKGSNVFLAGTVSNKSNMNYIEFDADMVNGVQAQSLLTVYVNTTKIGEIDGRVSDRGVEHYMFGAYLDTNKNSNSYPGPIVPGTYTLSFRLDTFADGAASAELSNIKGGLIH